MFGKTIVLLVVGVALIGCVSDSPDTPPQGTQTPSVAAPEPADWLDVGAAGRVDVEGAEWVYLATSQAAMGELLDVANASDVDGLRRLADQGKVFRVPNRTAVRVVGRSTLVRQVRIAEAGRVYSDREGWIQAEFVKPPPPPPAAPMPQYRVLDRVGGYVDVLLPSVAIGTPSDSLAGLARVIARAEGANEVSLYRTEAAFRANFSSSYARQNPNALRDGYLGGLSGGRFTPSSYR